MFAICFQAVEIRSSIEHFEIHEIQDFRWSHFQHFHRLHPWQTKISFRSLTIAARGRIGYTV